MFVREAGHTSPCTDEAAALTDIPTVRRHEWIDNLLVRARVSGLALSWLHTDGGHAKLIHQPRVTCWWYPPASHSFLPVPSGLFGVGRVSGAAHGLARGMAMVVERFEMREVAVARDKF